MPTAVEKPGLTALENLVGQFVFGPDQSEIFGQNVKAFVSTIPADQHLGELVSEKVLSTEGQGFAPSTTHDDTSSLIGSEPGPGFGDGVVVAASGMDHPSEPPNALGQLVSEVASGGQPQLGSTESLELLPPNPIEPDAVGGLMLNPPTGFLGSTISSAIHDVLGAPPGPPEVTPPEISSAVLAILGVPPGPPEGTPPTAPGPEISSDVLAMLGVPPGPPEVTPPTAPPGPGINSDVHTILGATDLGASTFVHTGLSHDMSHWT